MKTLLPLLVSLLALTGCARNYVVIMNSGQRYSAAGKPHLDNGFYRFTDASGRQQSVFAGQVYEIAPASMANDSPGMFKVSPSK